MSLITLTSKDIYADPTDTDHYGASALRCNFREGIPLHPGDSVSLVNMSLSTSANLNIIRDYNDTIVFVQGTAGGDANGNGRVFTQKIVKIPEGSYTSQELSAYISSSMNAATVFGCFRSMNHVFPSGWQCVYQAALQTPAAVPKYTITCIQTTDTDAIAGGGNINSFIFVRGEEGTLHTHPSALPPHETVSLDEFEADDFDLTTYHPVIGPPVEQQFNSQFYNNGDYDARAPGFIGAGENGIFPNNGATEFILQPTYLIDVNPGDAGPTISDLAGFRTDDGSGGFLNSTMELVWIDGTTHICRWEAPGANLTNLWQWKLVDETAPANQGFTSFWYAYFSPEGTGNGMWLVRDGTAATATVAGICDGDKKPVDPLTNEIQWTNLSGSDGSGYRGMPCWNIEVMSGQEGVNFKPDGSGDPLNIRMALMEPIGELSGLSDQWEQAGMKRPEVDSDPGIYADLGVSATNMQIVSLSRNGGYGRNNFGFVRKQIYRAPGGSEGEMTAGPDSIWNSGSNPLPGFDVVACIENPDTNNTAGDPVGAAGFATPHMSVCRLKQNRPFPEAGWRNGDYIPWKGGATHADPWGGDTVAGSWLKVRIEIQECLQWAVRVDRTNGPPAGDFATAGEWTGLQTIWDTRGQTAAPGTTLTKESHYQLRPAFALNRGGYYHRNVIQTGLNCCFDPVGHPDSLAEEGTAGVGEEFPEELHYQLQNWPTASGQKLMFAQLVKFGEVRPDQIGTGTGQLAASKVVPNVANTDVLLGMPTFKDYLKGQYAEPLFESVDAPQEETDKPELLVSLPQFPIKSWNGASTDTGKVIHVVPGEELHTTQTTGELFYAAPFKIPIDLRIQHSQVMYELTALITNSDGTMNQGMRHPTNITLLIEPSPESKLAEAMTKAMNNREGQLSNAQSAQIATIGDSNPRV